jgi:hypothetical protein
MDWKYKQMRRDKVKTKKRILKRSNKFFTASLGFVHEIYNGLSRMIKRTATDISKIVLKVVSILMFVATFLIGCSNSKIQPNYEYEYKQVQRSNFETTYVICKRCLTYTKFNKGENKDAT